MRGFAEVQEQLIRLFFNRGQREFTTFLANHPFAIRHRTQSFTPGEPASPLASVEWDYTRPSRRR